MPDSLFHLFTTEPYDGFGVPVAEAQPLPRFPLPWFPQWLDPRNPAVRRPRSGGPARVVAISEAPSRPVSNRDSRVYPRDHPADLCRPVLLASRVHEAAAVVAAPSAVRLDVLYTVVGDPPAVAVALLWYVGVDARVAPVIGEPVRLNWGTTPPVVVGTSPPPYMGDT